MGAIKWRRLALVTAALVCLSSRTASGQGVEARQASEYDVKAAFLLNFAKFVEWPASSTSPFTICIVGDDPFGAVLDQLVEGETVQGRRIVVSRVSRVADSCMVVFAGSSQRDLARIVSNAGPGVLTVGEGERFLREGGMITFIVENRRVRFDINHKAVAAGGLHVSSKLLSVARTVRR